MLNQTQCLGGEPWKCATSCLLAWLFLINKIMVIPRIILYVCVCVRARFFLLVVCYLEYPWVFVALAGVCMNNIVWAWALWIVSCEWDSAPYKYHNYYTPVHLGYVLVKQDFPLTYIGNNNQNRLKGGTDAPNRFFVKGLLGLSSVICFIPDLIYRRSNSVFASFLLLHFSTVWSCSMWLFLFHHLKK